MADGRAASLLHVLVSHAEHGADRIAVSRHLGAAQDLARLAVQRNDGDVAVEADDLVGVQLLGQHTAGLMVSEPAVGHVASRDIGRQGAGEADQDLVN